MYLILLSLLLPFGHSIPLDEFFYFSITNLTCHPGPPEHGQVTQYCEASLQKDLNSSRNVQVNEVLFPYFGENIITNISVSYFYTLNKYIDYKYVGER